MSLSQLTEVLNEIARRLDEQVVDIVSIQAMNELHAEFQSRVFEQGLNSDGEQIGEYSEKPGYYSKEKFIQKEAFKPQGKRGFKGERLKQTGSEFIIVKKNPKTMYLKKGYKELRDIQGRPVDKVNLDYSNSLKKAYRVFQFGDVVVYGQNDEQEHKKINKLTAQFGTWQELTEDEKTLLKNSLGEGVKAIVKL